MNDYIIKLRQFLESNNSDAILINSADEFLSEYNILQLNSRYKVTGFSGSMGDCIVTKDKVYQIVDGRYHEQADNEVNHNIVTVLKMQQGSSPVNEILGILNENSTLTVTTNKISVSFYEKLFEKAKEKNICIKNINNDPIDDLSQNDYTNVSLTLVNKNISGLSEEEKFQYFSSKLKNNQILLVTTPVNFAYLTNLRNYDFPYSSAPRAKAVVSKNKIVLFSNSTIPFDFKGLEVKKLSEFKNYIENLENKEILIDKTTISQSDCMCINLSNKIIDSNIFEIKSEKNNNEIAHLKESFIKTDKVLKKMEDLINSEK